MIQSGCNEVELLTEEYRMLTERYAGNAYTGHRLR